MIYNNLIYFLVAIFTFSTNTAPQQPALGAGYGLLVFLLFLFLFYTIAGNIFRASEVKSSASYFRAEKKLSILALLFFIGTIYILDIKYYLQPLSLDGSLPVLENIGGVALFFLFLSLLWYQARKSYQVLFNRSYSSSSFIISNIKANLPIVLPWLVISFVFDLLLLVPSPGFNQALSSPWGDLILFGVFVLFLVLFFPPLVKILWNCKPMPEGPLRSRLEQFCLKQNFHSEILLWPLFEGQVLTAGIMGIIPRFRYLLITPALLATMSIEEIDAVLAHEIGHVKKMHLVLYLFLFLGFSLLAGSLATPLPYLILSSPVFYKLLEMTNTNPETLIAILGAVPLLVLMLVYFRFIFGYYIRNFERQADLHVFKSIGNSDSLVAAFEKIAVLSGNIRSQKSWHHFGIGERIDFLLKCEKDRKHIRNHDRKVYASLVAYFFILVFAIGLVRQIDTEALAQSVDMRYMEAVLQQKLRQEPNKGMWLRLIGDLMQEKKMEQKALQYYEKALEFEPLNADLHNNLAWLLLTAQDPSLRDKERALTLARSAVTLKEAGHILDTLATAYWANNLREEAILTEMKAIQSDPKNRKFYKKQIVKFAEEVWGKQTGQIE